MSWVKVTAHEPVTASQIVGSGVCFGAGTYSAVGGAVGDHYEVQNGCEHHPRGQQKADFLLRAVPVHLPKRTDTISKWQQAQRARTKQIAVHAAIKTRKFTIEDLYDLPASTLYCLLNPGLALCLLSSHENCDVCQAAYNQLQSGLKVPETAFFQIPVEIRRYTSSSYGPVYTFPRVNKCYFELAHDHLNMMMMLKDNFPRDTIYFSRLLSSKLAGVGMRPGTTTSYIIHDQHTDRMWTFDLQMGSKQDSEAWVCIDGSTVYAPLHPNEKRARAPDMMDELRLPACYRSILKAATLLHRGYSVQCSKNAIYIRSTKGSFKDDMAYKLAKDLDLELLVFNDFLKSMYTYPNLGDIVDDVYHVLNATSRPKLVLLNQCELFFMHRSQWSTSSPTQFTFKPSNNSNDHANSDGDDSEDEGKYDDDDDASNAFRSNPKGKSPHPTKVCFSERLAELVRQSRGLKTIWVLTETSTFKADEKRIPLCLEKLVFASFEIALPTPEEKSRWLDHYFSSLKTHFAQQQIDLTLDPIFHKRLVCEYTHNLSHETSNTFLTSYFEHLTTTLESMLSLERQERLQISISLETFPPPAELFSRHSVLNNTQQKNTQVISWTELEGLDEVKNRIEDLLSFSLLHGDQFQHHQVGLPKGILLYGPPGNGKTMVAKALTTHLNARLYAIDCPSLVHGEVGESEKTLRRIFTAAKENSPSVIFIDEIQAIFGSRDAAEGDGATRLLVSQLFAELDALTHQRGLVVLAATNLPWALDPSLLRPGRLDQQLYVGLPTRQVRKTLLAKSLVQSSGPELDIDALADKTENYSAADLTNLVRQASRLAFFDAISTPEPPAAGCQVTEVHLQQALCECPPSTPAAILDEFTCYRNAITNPR